MKEKLSRFALSLMLALALYAAFLPTASADDLTESLHVAVDGTGAYLFSISGEISEGDEYISADNILYRIASVQNGNAIAEKIGEEAMPDVSWLEVGEAQPVFASEIAVPAANIKSDDSRKLIAMYITHSDESYVPSDGTQSVNGQGGIYDVARNFRDALQQQGIDVILDESTHLPHDSGAYRRSRQTAERLLQKGPDAIIDIHRDGIPDQNEYACSIDGENASRVRLLVGRANQNSTVNREFAKQIKAVADKQYPGLVKDIFIGKGTYNQDLAPHAILLEFGTHTISKERVLNSTEMMAKVVSNTLYGPQTGSAISEKKRKRHIRHTKIRCKRRQRRFRRRDLPDCSRRRGRAHLCAGPDGRRQGDGRKNRAKHQRNDGRPFRQKTKGWKRITFTFILQRDGFSARRAFFIGKRLTLPPKSAIICWVILKKKVFRFHAPAYCSRSSRFTCRAQRHPRRGNARFHQSNAGARSGRLSISHRASIAGNAAGG